jgi:hypothetical protein
MQTPYSKWDPGGSIILTTFSLHTALEVDKFTVDKRYFTNSTLVNRNWRYAVNTPKNKCFYYVSLFIYLFT